MKKFKEIESKMSSKQKIWIFFYNIILFLGLFLIIFEVLIYRKTIISIYIPISIILIVGLLAFYFNKKNYNKIYPSANNFISIIQNIMSWGFITSYLFLAINYYLAEKTITNYKLKIKGKSSMPGSKYHREDREPLVKVDYFTFEKELVFNFEDTDKVNSADSVEVSVRKGRLGFDILDSYDVINNK